MRFAITVIGALTIAGLAVPALADPVVTRHTTVTRVHGPMKLLPHHKRKLCKTRWVHHKRVKKCWYH
ncbi:MAG TPA: hypothetical protein VGC28_08825 [Sphingomonas sp.]